MSSTTLSAPWAGATVATVMPPLLHCPIATPGFPRGNNQCSTAESIQAAHAVSGIQTHHPLIRGNLCLRTATTSRMTKSLQPTHQRELVHALACTTTATWTLFIILFSLTIGELEESPNSIYISYRRGGARKRNIFYYKKLSAVLLNVRNRLSN